MPDLKVTDAELDATAARLREASLPIHDGVSFAPAIVGSDIVATALGEAVDLFGHLGDALSAVAEDTAADAAGIGVALSEVDARLTGGG